MQDKLPPVLLPVLEAMEYIGYTRTRLFEEMREGRLDVRKAGRRNLITKASLDKRAAELPRSRPYHSDGEVLQTGPAALLAQRAEVGIKNRSSEHPNVTPSLGAGMSTDSTLTPKTRRRDRPTPATTSIPMMEKGG